MLSLIIKAWSIVLLLPVVPVSLIYLFFSGENYFELTDPAKGIVAVGPIAAYIGLVLIGWRIYSRMSKGFTLANPLVKDIVGSWHFEAHSAGGHLRKGVCTIKYEEGLIHMNGEFKVEDKHLGNWNSELAILKGGNMHIVYELKEINEEGIQTMEGVCTLTLGEKPIRRMSGVWAVVGKEGMSGTIIYVKE